MSIRRAAVAALSSLSLFAAACGGAGEAPASAQPRNLPVVDVASVTGHDEAVTLEATGSFEPLESSDVAPEASGRVIATPVDVGQFVREGAVLVRIQGVDAGLRLDEARAAVTRST